MEFKKVLLAKNISLLDYAGLSNVLESDKKKPDFLILCLKQGMSRVRNLHPEYDDYKFELKLDDNYNHSYDLYGIITNKGEFIRACNDNK